MKDIKKIQEFFSKPLNEDPKQTYQVAVEDFEEVVQKVKSTGHPATIGLDPEFNEIDIIIGMDAPYEISKDIDNAIKSLPSRERLSISGDSSSFGRGRYSKIERVNGGHKDYFEESLNEMEFGDPVDAVFRKYAGKTIEMDFEDMESDWANLLNDLEEYFPGDKLSDFMDSGEADLYLDDYNITLMEPIMDKDVDLDVLKRAKAKMDIDKMRYDAGMPPMDSIASLNEEEDIDFEYRAVLDKFKDIMKGLDVKEADALQQKLKAYFAGLDENMKKSFADYTNQELAAYVKNTKDKEAAKELHKRSQKLKDLSRTDIEEIDKDKLAKMRAANAGDDGNDKFFDAAKLRALKAIQTQLDDLGVKYEMSGNPYKPFKAVYKPVNKDDRWYKDFDDIIFRYNLGGVVKTSMDEATKEEETTFHKKLDKLVHDTFGKRKGELEEEVDQKQADIYAYEFMQYFDKMRRIVGSNFGDDTRKEFEKLVQNKFSNHTVNETEELTEAYVPSNIKDFAKRRGISSLVNKVAGWAEKVGARITGGTAIGKNYNTLILDLGYQTADIRIDIEDETIELYDEPVYSFADFKNVFIEEVTRQQMEHDEEQLRRERGLEEKIAEALDKINEELCPAGKAYIKKRQAAGEKSSAYLSGRAVKVCKGQMKG